MNKITHLSVKGVLSVLLAITCAVMGVTVVAAYDTQGVSAQRDSRQNTEITFVVPAEYTTEPNYSMPTEPTEPPTQATEKETEATQATEATEETTATEPTENTQAETQPTSQATEPTEPVVLQTLPPLNISEDARQALYQQQWNAGYLYAVDYPDYGYVPSHVELTPEDRDVCERLVMGEFGSGGFIGAALIAQCIRDAMVYDGYKTVEEVRIKCRYDGRIDLEPNSDVKGAVSYVFDQDKPAVQHRLFYMYNPQLCTSQWHESMAFVLSYEDVRFFDRPW